MSRSAAELRRLQVAAGGPGGAGPAARGPWRAVDPEAGDVVFVCAACWPLVEAEWRARADVTVRVLRRRPKWARCGVCDPERVC